MVIRLSDFAYLTLSPRSFLEINEQNDLSCPISNQYRHIPRTYTVYDACECASQTTPETATQMLACNHTLYKTMFD
jgi:hypothetical protein